MTEAADAGRPCGFVRLIQYRRNEEPFVLFFVFVNMFFFFCFVFFVFLPYIHCDF